MYKYKNLSVLLMLSVTAYAIGGESVCFGTTSDGYLENGVKLPTRGKNFKSYSVAAEWAGRTYVHSEVKDIVISAYKNLEQEQPNKVFKYAETGHALGGQFKPHKTHRNGLSVDFMVPVLNQKGESVYLPTNVFNKLGYSIEFNNKGQYKEFTIDYVALAAHIVALHKEATLRGHNLWRVIFALELQSNLYETRYGAYLKTHIQFSTRSAWVRHDEHYHIDFDLPCEKLSKVAVE